MLLLLFFRLIIIIKTTNEKQQLGRFIYYTVVQKKIDTLDSHLFSFWFFLYENFKQKKKKTFKTFIDFRNKVYRGLFFFWKNFPNKLQKNHHCPQISIHSTDKKKTMMINKWNWTLINFHFSVIVFLTGPTLD